MGLGGKQPRFPGKTPRFPGKQPRRTIASDSEEEEEPQEVGRSAEEAKENLLDSDDDEDMQIADEGDVEDEEYEEDEDEEEEEEPVDRFGFLKGTEYLEDPKYYDVKRIDDLLLLLPQREQEKVALLKGIKREARIGEIHEKYQEGHHHHTMRRRRLEHERKKEARKPRAQKQKEQKKEALQELMKSQAQMKRATTHDDDEDDDGIDADDQEDDIDDDDEDYEEPGYGRKVKRRGKQKRSGRDSIVEDELDAQIMEAIVSDDEEQDETARMDTSTRMYEKDEYMEPVKPATLDEINKIRLPRAYIVNYVDEPFFEELVTGAFVRFHVGKNIYRVARVRSVQEHSRPYSIDDGRGKKIQTRRLLDVVVHEDGKGKKMDLTKLSNKRIQEDELQNYEAELGSAEELISSTDARRIAERLKTLPKKYQYKASDVQKITSSKGVEMGGNSSMRRINELEKELNSLRDELREKRATLQRASQVVKDSSSDGLEAAPVEKENLREAERAFKAVENRVVVARNRHKTLVQNERKRAERAERIGGGLDSINQRNELENVTTILQSGERKRKAARAALSTHTESSGAIDGHISRGGSSDQRKAQKTTFDPFKRRLTRPTILWATKKEDEEKKEENSSVILKSAPASPAAPVKKVPAVAAKPRVTDLEMLMCDAVTPDLDPAVDSTDEQAMGSSSLRLAARVIRLPWPLPIVDPTQAAMPVPSREKTNGKMTEGRVQKSFFLLNELECAERCLVQSGRKYRAIKMYLNMHRWTQALDLAKSEDSEYLDLVLARRLAYLDRVNTPEHLLGFKQLANRASQLDIDAVTAATERLDARDREMNSTSESVKGTVYTFDEYHATRESQS